jgi:hypothetical protein
MMEDSDAGTPMMEDSGPGTLTMEEPNMHVFILRISRVEIEQRSGKIYA